PPPGRLAALAAVLAAALLAVALSGRAAAAAPAWLDGAWRFGRGACLRAWRGMARWERWSFALLLAAGALTHLALRWPLLTDARTDLGGAEINVAYGIQKLLLGKPLYSDPESPPFEVVQYTPLYHALCAALCRVSGVDAMDTAGIFRASRACCLALNLIAAALLLLLCRKLEAPAWIAMGAACLSLALMAPHFYGRPDALATPLMMGALLALMSDRPATWPRAALGAMLAMLAVMAKQTAIVAPVIIAAHLALQRDSQGLKRSVACLSGFGTLALGALLAVAPPAVLWRNLVVSARNGMGFTLYRELADRGILKHWLGWMVLAALASIALLRKGSAKERLAALGALIALAAGLAEGLKSGSGLNYLADGLLLGLAATCAWLARLRAPVREAAAIAVLAFGALFMQHRLRLLHGLAGSPADRAAHEAALRADRAVLAWLQDQWVDAAPAPVLVLYRGHLELLLNGAGLLPPKDIIEWSARPPFALPGLERMLEQGAVAHCIAAAPIDSVRLPGWACGVEPLARVESRYIYRPLPAQR
ncbi:MAG: hypothetical protein ACK4L7_03425, partial [Flavobacteriales bacterium]